MPDSQEILQSKTLIVVVGPTAIGKTDLAIKLAKHYNTAIVSADSRQFFREMAIGTAKPSPYELEQAKHYFINSHSVKDHFNAGDFETEGLKVLEAIFTDNDTAILAGGSGLYIHAICKGFDQVPSGAPGVRKRLNTEYENNGIAEMAERLKIADPTYFAQVDLNNSQRIIRALEVIESTGKPLSSYHVDDTRQRPFNMIKVGLNLPRELLYQRINLRVDIMVQQGLVKEVKSLLPYRDYNALNTVGYKEIFDYLDGTTDLETAIAFIKQNTRRFAKRQLTWFNKDKSINWFKPTDFQNIVNHIDQSIQLL
jgi:tRNA dimethylallyltransferase